MGKRERKVKLVRVTPEELLAAGLAQRAVIAAAEALHAGGYPKPTEPQFDAIAATVTQAALLMPHLIADVDATTDEQLETAAETLGASVVAEVLGTPPGAC